MDSSERELRQYILDRFLAFSIESEDRPDDPAIVSGFLLEVCQNWYWVTAAHCFEDIQLRLQRSPGVVGSFLAMNGNIGSEIPVAVDSLVGLDQRTIARFLSEAEALHWPVKTSRLDAVAVFITPYIKSVLRSKGLQAFSNLEIESTVRVLEGIDGGVILIAGVPRSKLGPDVEPRRVKFELHFNFATPLTDSEHYDEGDPLLWAKIRDFIGSTEGMSGGPCIVSRNGSFRVIGLQSRERTKSENNSSKVGIADIWLLIDSLSALFPEPFFDNTAREILERKFREIELTTGSECPVVLTREPII